MRRQRKRRKKKREEQPILYECAWCRKAIPEDDPVWTLGGRAQSGIDLTEHKGTVMDMYVAAAGKMVPVMVTTEDSELKKRKGYDLLFMLCSQPCGLHLREALAEDLQIKLD